jgi:aryl-alcohol dehydrogenase-like predicted oxidoreductase
MRYRTYPGTELTVSAVGFGLWTTATGWWGEMTDNDAVALLDEAHNTYGVTLFDAADTYGNGRSEAQLATAFAKCRDKVIYATKFGYDFPAHAGERRGQQEIPQNFSADYVRRALEGSLERLQTEYIDLYQIHNARMEQIESDELFGLLEEFRREGKIRAYGVALGPAIGWLGEGVEAVTKRNVTSLQIIYNLLEQFPGDAMLETAERVDAATGFMIRVPHSSGLLEGRYTAETTFPSGDHRRHRPHSWLLNGLHKVEKLRFLELPNRTLGQASLQWLLANPRVMTLLPNIYDRDGLREFASTCETPPLTPDELDRIAELARVNFGVEESPGSFKGTMTREPALAESAAG